MALRDYSKYFLYRWRYVIGYSLIGVALAGLLLFAGLYLPGGLSATEMTSVINSTGLSLGNPSTYAIHNLPYYGLQAIVFAIFGVSILTIKLPSLILALFSAIGLVLLLRRWFKPSIAVLASLIAISTSQFLFIAQLGTPSILYIFWPIVLLFLGTQITRVKKYRLLWKILFVISAALNLYTPLGIYTLIAIGLAVIFHPHLRNVVRRLKRSKLIIVISIFIALISPLIWFIIQKPQLGLTLLGVPSALPVDFGLNVVTVLKQYFLFWEPSTAEVLRPVFGLGSVLLVVLGLHRLILTRETTRSYLIIFWIICLLPVLIFNPSFTTVTFVPTVLMLAAGLTSLITYWYRLFPLNPYARIAGLIPIIILVAALITSGITRYIYGYHYGPKVAPLFSKDLILLPKDTKQLVVSEDEFSFYQAVASYSKNYEVVKSPTAKEFVVTHNAKSNIQNYNVKRIITNSMYKQADRFYVLEQKQQ